MVVRYQSTGYVPVLRICFMGADRALPGIVLTESSSVAGGGSGASGTAYAHGSGCWTAALFWFWPWGGGATNVAAEKPLHQTKPRPADAKTIAINPSKIAVAQLNRNLITIAGKLPERAQR